MYGVTPPQRPPSPSPPAIAQSGWRTIALKTVDCSTDVDRIIVRGASRSREVRLCVFNAPLRMCYFNVRFENNQRQDVRVRERIASNRCTRDIDLTGNRRDIEWGRLKKEPIQREHARAVHV